GRVVAGHRSAPGDPTMTLARRRTDWALFARLLSETRPYGLHLIGLFAIGLLAAPLTALTPLPLKVAVDSALGSPPLPRFLRLPGVPPSRALALAVAVGLLALVATLRQLQELASQALQAFVVEKQTLDLRARLFLHVQRLSLSHHDRGGTAESIARIDKDAREAQAIVVESVFPS